MEDSTEEWKLFVVQKHEAAHLHYDFRLQVEGVLKSWAVPKGPSLDPHKKRLAVAVQDHSLSHAQYEDENVKIWDKGSYRNITGLEQEGVVIPFTESYENGVIEIELKGDKLQGKWVLVKMKKEAGEANWLLIKKDDQYAQKNN